MVDHDVELTSSVQFVREYPTIIASLIIVYSSFASDVFCIHLKNNFNLYEVCALKSNRN